jgi:hypothetical protein
MASAQQKPITIPIKTNVTRAQIWLAFAALSQTSINAWFEIWKTGETGT